MAEIPSFRSPEKQKRESGRVKLNIAGHYRFAGGEWHNCQLIDLSAGGLALEGKFSFYPGDVIELKFVLEQRNFFCRISISNIHGRKAGGKFVELPEADKNFIRDYLHRTFFGDKKTI